RRIVVRPLLPGGQRELSIGRHRDDSVRPTGPSSAAEFLCYDIQIGMIGQGTEGGVDDYRPWRLIALEGIEGAGKTTVAERLAARLQALGHAVVRTREPAARPTRGRTPLLPRAALQRTPPPKRPRHAPEGRG
ncbi:dTMP kinase, partial [Hydrogenibacillus schlegelii]|uniref:dTMP kinase n=1 Tax=Hydrogenibacillus schlegelii TaxID=1484 RepID=UPI003F63818C